MPDTWYQELETRNPKSNTRNPDTRYLAPEIGYPKPETSNLTPDLLKKQRSHFDQKMASLLNQLN